VHRDLLSRLPLFTTTNRQRFHRPATRVKSNVLFCKFPYRHLHLVSPRRCCTTWTLVGCDCEVHYQLFQSLLSCICNFSDVKLLCKCNCDFIVRFFHCINCSFSDAHHTVSWMLHFTQILQFDLHFNTCCNLTRILHSWTDFADSNACLFGCSANSLQVLNPSANCK
jgi:hypothetical protein